MKHPNAIWHMIRWGFVSGTILAMLFIAFHASLSSPTSAELLKIFFEPFFWMIALVSGGGAGLILGFIDGVLLLQMTRDVYLPFTQEEMHAVRYKIYSVIGITSIIGFYLWILFAEKSIRVRFTDSLGFSTPFIAGIAATYAAHRYLFRLRLWSKKAYENRKEKVKNSERLEDKLKHDTILGENEGLELSQHETS
jgi:hypothetical protein